MDKKQLMFIQARSPRAFGSRRDTGRNVLELPTGVVFTDVVCDGTAQGTLRGVLEGLWIALYEKTKLRKRKEGRTRSVEAAI